MRIDPDLAILWAGWGLTRFALGLPRQPFSRSKDSRTLVTLLRIACPVTTFFGVSP